MVSGSPQSFFNLLDSLTGFAHCHRILQFCATGPVSKRHSPRGGCVSAVHRSLFGSKLLNCYNPVSTKYNVPSSYLNEHSFAGPMCFNTVSPCTAALGTCHKWKADTTYQNTKSSFKNRGLHKKDWSTEFNIYAAILAPCLKVLPELGSFLQAFGRMFYSYLKTLFVSWVTNI